MAGHQPAAGSRDALAESQEGGRRTRAGRRRAGGSLAAGGRTRKPSLGAGGGGLGRDRRPGDGLAGGGWGRGRRCSLPAARGRRGLDPGPEAWRPRAGALVARWAPGRGGCRVRRRPSGMGVSVGWERIRGRPGGRRGSEDGVLGFVLGRLGPFPAGLIWDLA